MADLILNMDWDISKAEAKQRKLNREFDLSKQKAKNISVEINKTADSIEYSKNKIQEYSAEAEKLRNRAHQYNKGTITLTDKQVEAERRRRAELEKLIDKEQAHHSQLKTTLANQNYQLEKQNNKTADIGDQILLNNKKQSKFGETLEKSGKSVDRFGKRLKSLIASALFFSLVTKAFTALREEFGKLINEAGTKTASLLAQLNGNLSVMGWTLFEASRPAIEWILQKLVQITNVLTTGLARILGKNVEEMKKLTKETKKAGEEAKKATAGFDTIQTVDTSTNNSSDSGAAADFSNTGKGIEEEMLILTAIISGFLLVIGIILLFTGANVMLGLGLIALGAIGLAASIAAKWDSMSEKTKETIAGVMAIGGALFMLLGLVLILTGAGLPLGIGLILLGISLMGTAVALTPGDSFAEKVRNLWKKVKELTNTFLNWWTEKVINKAFGSAMGESVKEMWNSVMYLFEDIINFFVGVFTGDWKKVWKSLVNIVVDILNIMISSINQALQFVLGGGAKLINLLGKAFGADWNLNANWAKIPTIPRLATGAILPGGSPMLAYVNDQPKGQPYVEGSIENIAAAFEKYLGQKPANKLTVEATGSWAQFLRFMRLQLKEEDNRASIF